MSNERRPPNRDDDDVFDARDLTPPPASVEDLSRPLVHIDPTPEGLANALLNIHSKVLLTMTTSASTARKLNRLVQNVMSRDDCEANRATCAKAATAAADACASAASAALAVTQAAVLATRPKRPTSEASSAAKTAKQDVWEWLAKRAGALVSVFTLFAMIGAAWWWSARTISTIRVDQDQLKAQIIKELRANNGKR